MSDLSAPDYKNGVWHPLRPAIVAQKYKPSTMLSSNVKSFDLPHGLHSLKVLDDEAIEWLLNTCHDIWCSQAVDSNN